MIEQPTKIGNSELYTARVLNMAVAQHFGLVKEYCEIVTKARQFRREEEKKFVFYFGGELSLMYECKQELNKVILDKLNKEKILKFGANKR